MNDVGYLYVLANSAMPGLVKVGKTTRNPTERALELSGATGLPTAFIVVYEQLFIDCSAAEAFVHAYLEKRGFRIADNREFFNAPVNEVVRAITLAPGAMDNDAPQIVVESPDDFFDRREEPDELDSLSLDMPGARTHLWSSVLDEAQNHYYGNGDYIQDFAEALRHFRQAAKLGALPAYGYLGKMHEEGEGVRKDQGRALEYYKEGARKGSVYCYWAMGMLFASPRFPDARNPVNAEKCFSLFIKNMHDSLPDGLHLTQWESGKILRDCPDLILGKIMFDHDLPVVLHGFFKERCSKIAHAINKIREATLILVESGSTDELRVHEVYDQMISCLESIRE